MLRTVTINWSTDGGQAMLVPGDGLAGQPITTLSFELGTENFPDGGILDPDFLGFDHDPDPDIENFGTFLADFTLLTADGGVLFSGSWFVALDNLTSSIEGRTFIGAGGQNLSNFNIGGGTATVRYFVVPTPGAIGLFGLAGLSAVRRRRRA